MTDSIVPLQRGGAVTFVAAKGGVISDDHRARLEARHGPVTVIPYPQRRLDALAGTLDSRRMGQVAECRTDVGESSRTWSSGRVAALAALLAVTALASAVLWPVALIVGLTAWATLTLVSVTLLRTMAAFTRLRTGVPPAYPPVPDAALPIISVLVPLYRERDIAANLLRRLERLDYPRERLDLILVLEADDSLTRMALEKADLPPWMRVVPVPTGAIRTKPRALNYALDFAKGSIVGIYDAEDWPAPDQLRKVAAHFAGTQPDVACLQGRLSFYNARETWLTRCFEIDYATWFGLVLPGLVKLGFVVPLGGTTLFFRADILRKVGRWDAHNVTEDADLGIRLARRGFRIEFLASETREEATASVAAWVRQRSRWIKGYAVTWAVHMRRPLRLIGELGVLRFLGIQILFLGTLSQFVLAPLLWSFWLVLVGFDHPFAHASGPGWMVGVTAVFFAAEVLTLLVNALAVGSPTRRWLLPWVPMMHLYFPLASLASWKGLWELVTRPFYWDKTQHGHRRRRWRRV